MIAGISFAFREGHCVGFNLCSERRIRAIRLFQNQAAWQPNYTGSGLECPYQPVCLGPAYIAPPTHEVEFLLSIARRRVQFPSMPYAGLHF